MPPFWAILLSWANVIVGAYIGMISYRFHEPWQSWATAATLVVTGVLYFYVMCEEKPSGARPRRK